MQRVLLLFADSKSFPTKTKLLFSFMLLCFANFAISQTNGIYESYAILSINGGANAYYDMNAATGNPDFDGSNLGTFALGTNTLVVKGGQNKTFKCSGGDISNGHMKWRVWLTSAGASGTFNTENYGFVSNDAGGCGGNQTWEGTGGATNIISGRIPGNYTLEVYSDADGVPGTTFSSNGGNNYKATFTIAPNPAAQITVTATGGTTFATYATMALAVNAINAGTHTGTIFCYAPGGYTETAPAGGYSITATGTVGNVITFTRLSGGANPAFTANGSLVAGNLNDAIFKIIGGDYITIEGYQMLENNANLTTAAGTNNMTEWGVALLYATATNGCQNITIRNNIIDLNRNYQNTWGIYANSTHTATSVTTSATATGATGGNNNLVITGNGITDVNNGILVVGPAADADQNTNLTIGGSLINQNTITNFGTTGTFSSYVNVSGTVNGILVRNTKGFVVSFNAITSSTGGTTSGTLNGIQIPAPNSTTTGTFTHDINSNSISLQSGNATGAINGINIPSGSSTATSTVNINSNNFASSGHTLAASGAITFILNVSAHAISSISNNTFTNLSVNTTGNVTFISNSITTPAAGTKTINGNSIVGTFAKTGAGGTVAIYNDGGSSVCTTPVQNNNNNFSNITLTGATTMTGWFNNDGTGSTPQKQMTGNTFSNWTGGTNSVIVLQSNFGGDISMSTNTISNISGANTITGILQGSNGTITTSTLASNTITGLASTGGTVLGISSTHASTNTNVNGNSIRTLSSTTSSVTGISQSGAASTGNVFRNSVSDLLGSASTSTVTGISVTAGTTMTTHNNLVGDLRTPNANAANPLIGISITGSTTSNVYYNTVYLNGTSVGALFGSSALSASSSVSLTLRNNIFMNTSTPVGATGFTSAYRRSSTTLTSYGSASNNNLFYAGTPGTNNLIFFDGTNSDQTITAYKLRVSTRDSASVTENMTAKFLSTSGSNVNFLHLDPTIATQAESGGATIATFTTDYDGNTRNVSTPDIGADEFSGIPADFTGPTISYTNLTNATVNTTRAFGSVTITDNTGVNTTAGTKPRLYYKKSGDTNDVSGWKFVEANGTTSPFDFTIDYSLLTAGSVSVSDNIQYFVVAQDTASPTVTINSGNFNLQPTSVALGTNQFPITGTINSYNIAAAISGIKTVCPSGCDYPTLTVAGGAFAAINGAIVTGDVTLQIAGDLTTETGAVMLNEFASPYSVTIKPTGAPRNISGTSSTTLIMLFGADNVVIDGSLGSTANTVCPASSATRDLTITNTNSSSTSGVVGITNNLTNGSSNNTIKNCNIVGNSNTTTRTGIGSVNTGASGGNNSNSFINNNLSKSQFGISVQGLSAASKNSGTIINQNVIATASPNNVQIGGIFVGFETGDTISGNTVSGINSGTDSFGISLGLTSWVATTTSGSDVLNTTISNNIIGTVQNTGTNSAAGILVGPVTSGTNRVINNEVYGVTSNSTPGDLTAGIFVIPASGSSLQVYHNTVSLSGDRGTGTTASSLALAVGGSDTAIDIRNNILVNKQTTAAAGKSYAIGFGYSTFVNLTSNNNNFFTSGANANFAVTSTLNAGTDRTSLANLQAATGKDGASLNVDAVFTSSTDLRPAAHATNVPLTNAGADLSATVPSDIDCGTRSATPSLGFKEFTVVVCSGANGGTASATAPLICTSGSTTISSTGYTSGLNITYLWQSSVDLAFTTPIDMGVASATYNNLSTGTITSTTYYRLQVTCTAVPVTNYSNVVTVTVNPTPVVNVTPPSATYCSGGTVNLVANGATTYSWSPATGLDATTGASVNANPTVTTTYTVIGTTNGCASAPVNVIVTVNPVPPTPVAGSNTPVCEGGTLNLTSSTVSLTGYSMNGNSGVSFVDISATGTSAGTIADDSEHNLTIPSFTFNGVAYTTARVGNNGILVFGTTTGDIIFNNSALPQGIASGATATSGLITGTGNSLAAIVANWDDMQPLDVTSTIKTQTVGNLYIVQWSNEDNFNAAGSGTITFQIQLDTTTGQIHLVYPDLTYGVPAFDAATSATIGLNYSASSALQYSFNTASIVDGQSISFTPNSVNYSWTGPNSFSSALQNPSISNVTTAAAGTYIVTATNPNTGCFSTANTVVAITPAAVGGSVNGGTTICSGSTSGLLTLSGDTGTIVRWESSVSPFITWSPIVNTTHTYTSGALTQTTRFRAVLQNGACTPVNSNYTIVTVDAPSVGGSVTGGTTVCSGSTSGLLTLAGETGTIVRWESSVSPFTTWSPIVNTAHTYTSGALTQTTEFRAVVQNGVCSEAFSSATTVTVNTPSVGGSVTGGTTICTGSTSGLLTLSGETGTVVRWESSVSPFTTWSPIVNTANTYTSGALTQTTEFRAVVQSGVCSEAFSSATTVTVTPASVGGSVTGGTAICFGSPAGLLTLSGETGTVVRWESSVSPFTTWAPIANTGNTHSPGAITQTSQYRAVVQNGVCAEAFSSTTTVTVDQPSQGGNVSGGTTICSGSTSGLLTLSGETGTVVRWESSVSPFTTWSPIVNTANTYTSGALTQTTEFRAVVQSGVCSEAFSSATTVTVNAPSVGGSVTGGTTICSGSTSGLLTLSGEAGTIVRWESSVSPFNTWSPIVNTSNTYTSGALTQTTEFRAVVQNGVCSEAFSSATTVTVNASSAGGSVSGGTAICTGSTSGLLTLTGETGTIVRWESSVSPFTTWSPIVNTTNTYTSGALTQDTAFRAVVQNGVCGEANSSATTVTVSPVSVGGAVSGGTSVCSGSNSGVLTLSGHTGAVVRWESSVSPFTTWTPIANTNTTYVSGAITEETHFRAVVQSGPCSQAISSETIIAVGGSSTTWSSGSWSNGTPNSTSAAVINGNFTSTADLYACTLTIQSGTVSFAGGFDAYVNGKVTVTSGTLTFEDGSDLVQTNEIANTGNIKYKRTANLIRQDYVYWSSPVSGQMLQAYSPGTLNTRFYNLDEPTNSFAQIASPSTTSFDAARGYMIRSANNHPAVLTPWTGTFTGVPRNGEYTIPVTVSGQGYNMIGNPYPSTVDADLYLAQPGNAGTLYFWTHTSQAASSGANYATYNTMGGTAAQAGGSAPTGAIRGGQGFVQLKTSAGTATFTNAMRTAEGGAFYRSASTVEKHRMWFNLNTPAHAMNQILVGYAEGATMGEDISMDGKLIEGGSSISSIIGSTNYVIQARSLPFVDTDVVPLSFNAGTAGTYIIELDHVDGLFEGDQNIYLKDNLLGTVHNIKQGAYSFASAEGTFANRFEVVYQSSPLGVETPTFDANSVVVYKEQGMLHINSGTTVMSGVKIFDIRGRLIYKRNAINATETVLNDLRAEEQVLLVQITSVDNEVVTKKVAY